MSRLPMPPKGNHCAIAYARRHATPFALVLLDLNGFKQVNDGYGHDAGDALLKSIAERLTEIIRAEDTVARLGGDEFALLLTDADEPARFDAVLARIHASLKRPIQLGRAMVQVSCSAGMARYPRDGVNLQALLKAADLRLYEQKADSPTSRRPRFLR